MSTEAEARARRLIRPARWCWGGFTVSPTFAASASVHSRCLRRVVAWDATASTSSAPPDDMRGAPARPHVRRVARPCARMHGRAPERRSPASGTATRRRSSRRGPSCGRPRCPGSPGGPSFSWRLGAQSLIGGDAPSRVELEPLFRWLDWLSSVWRG